MTPDLGKTLIVIGVVIALVGLFISFGGKWTFLGKIPGDIRIERENFTFFLPLGTCLLISALLSLIFWLFRK